VPLSVPLQAVDEEWERQMYQASREAYDGFVALRYLREGVEAREALVEARVEARIEARVEALEARAIREMLEADEEEELWSSAHAAGVGMHLRQAHRDAYDAYSAPRASRETLEDIEGHEVRETLESGEEAGQIETDWMGHQCSVSTGSTHRIWTSRVARAGPAGARLAQAHPRSVSSLVRGSPDRLLRPDSS